MKRILLNHQAGLDLLDDEILICKAIDENGNTIPFKDDRGNTFTIAIFAWSSGEQAGVEYFKWLENILGLSKLEGAPWFGGYRVPTCWFGWGPPGEWVDSFNDAECNCDADDEIVITSKDYVKVYNQTVEDIAAALVIYDNDYITFNGRGWEKSRVEFDKWIEYILEGKHKEDHRFPVVLTDDEKDLVRRYVKEVK